MIKPGWKFCHQTIVRVALSIVLWNLGHGEVEMSCSAQERLRHVDPSEIDLPEVLDPRLKIELVIAEPDLVTPTGIAIDRTGALFVIESHTHFRPDNYDGPPADRIRRFLDTDGDGKFDVVNTFFEGTTATMNLAFHDNGDLYVATRSEVFRLRDDDLDGVAEQRTPIVQLESTGRYPHNGLSGFAFDLEGQMFFGFGENLGHPYTLHGQDGTQISGGGEGGNIFRCDLEGNRLQRWATGFWNPFHVCLDDFGQLFAVDNDPDWRPPCRLLHIVDGGDYGYRFDLGRRGTHPFSSWFGDVPGTLGMVAGTGEAPSGVVSYYSDQLPEDYRDVLITTSWGIHAIEAFRLQPRGATFSSIAETIVKGGKDFRPVSIAVAPSGDIYFTDWVKRDYELHGHGRVWRLSCPDAEPRLPEASLQQRFQTHDRAMIRAAALELVESESGSRWLSEQLSADAQADPAKRSIAAQVLLAQGKLASPRIRELIDHDPDARLRVMLAGCGKLVAGDHNALLAKYGVMLLQRPETPQEVPHIVAALLRTSTSETSERILWMLCRCELPFLQQAVREALSRRFTAEELTSMRAGRDDSQRRQLVHLLMSVDSTAARSRLADLLDDNDTTIRFLALRWIGERGLTEYGDQVADKLLTDENIEDLFEAYLATLDLLAGERTGAQFEQQEIRHLEQLLTKAIERQDELSMSLLTRRLVHSYRRDRMTDPPEKLQPESLMTLAQLGQIEALFAAQVLPGEEYRRLLREVVSDAENFSDRQRLVAAGGLSNSAIEDVDTLKLLWLDESDDLQLKREYLRHAAVSDPSSDLRTLIPAEPSQVDVGVKQDWLRVVDREAFTADKPAASEWEAWQELLGKSVSADPSFTEDDIAAGERLFFHAKIARCGSCHTVHNRGGSVGPDLSNVAQLGPVRILESILLPSREIAPKYATWNVLTIDGRVVTGILITERGSDQLYGNADGEIETVHFDDIEERRADTTSLMPDGLLHEMTTQEIHELLAYLMSLR